MPGVESALQVRAMSDGRPEIACLLFGKLVKIGICIIEMIERLHNQRRFQIEWFFDAVVFDRRVGVEKVEAQ